MEEKVICNKSTLEAMADKIREKTGSTEKLSWNSTDGFSSELENVKDNRIDILIDGSLTEVNSNVTSIRDSAFADCTALTSVNFPVATSINFRAFDGCTRLTTVDFPAVTSISSQVFQSCSQLKSLILRSETAATLNNSSAFSGSGVSSGTGYIYVPKALIEGYKTATNWSAYASQFRALEDYTVDGTITGALDETKINA